MLTATLPTVSELKMIIAERQQRSRFISPAVSRDPHTEVANRKIWMRGITFRVERSARTACGERGKQNGGKHRSEGNKAQPPTHPSHS